MKVSLIFLRGPFKLSNGKTFSLGKELGYDQNMLLIVLFVPIGSPEKMKSFDNHITECISNSQGILSTIESVRELFYESAAQWCEQHLPKPGDVKLLGEPYTANGLRLINVVKLIADMVSKSSDELKCFFSGKQVNMGPPNGRCAKELKQLARTMTKAGKLENDMFCVLMEVSGEMQLRRY